MKIIVWGLVAGVVLGWGGIAWRRRWLQDEAQRIDGLIKPPTYTFTDHDDTLRQRADQRKVIAEDLRRRAALCAAGQQKPADVRKFRREA